MKKSLILLLSLFAIAIQAKEYPYKTVEGDPLQARIYTLDNGLTVYLTQNKEKPEIQTFIAVRAGSQNDPLESTGLAHYLEHIMFKGTRQYGTTDYERELPNLRAIDSLYEVYGKTVDPEKRKAIYHQIDSFSYESSKIAIANEFDKLISGIGATGVNAYTSTEMTCYHEVIPAGELTRWAMIESDRFQHLVIRGFHTELEAVYEEFNMNSTRDNRKVFLALDQALFPDIPYRQHTTLGTQEHLKNPSLVNIRRFYDTYYRPNNVAVCLSGDFEFDHAIAVVDRWFGAWEPRPIPAFHKPEQADLKAPKDTTVYGNEAPQVWLGWKLPDVRHEDIDALEIMAEVLQNGKCGLLDVDVNQKQLVLYAASGINTGNDYSMFLMLGAPKEKQDLGEVRRVLLAEADKLKKGEFSEDMLAAIIKNMKRNELIGLQSNNNRVDKFITAHIYQIPYEEIVSELDRKSHITKEDIVRVANRYLTDSYVCVNKVQGEDANPPKVDKPTITPIEMNREKHSAFYEKVMSMESERLEPQFLDMQKDLSVSTLPGNIQLLYRQNTENELGSLSFVIRRGNDQDLTLDLAESMLDYLGTAGMSVDEYQAKLYADAAEAWVHVQANETEIGVYGLQETMPDALALVEEHILTAKPDEEVYAEVVSDIIKSHEDAKSNQRACFSHLRAYAEYGKKAVTQRTLTPKQLKKTGAAASLAHLRAILPAIERVEYYGPLSEEEVKKMLSSSKLLNQADPAKRTEPKRIVPQQVSKSEVLIAPYVANNTYMMAYANWGEVYNPKELALIRLFNEYFDGSMGGIVFQEMRESRALCYGSSAGYVTPSYKGDNNSFFTYVLTQTDKLADCIETFDSICNHMPLSEAAFVNAKESLLKQIERRRYVRSAPISAYLSFTRLGWDHDMWQDIYKEVQNLTLDDIVRFQKEHVANRTYKYIILANPDDLDLKYLKTKGKVRSLKTKDIFVY
ncbi:MAG: insulinase family protein [Paludibacteraceae bacterium]|nr:insulinase family protein [Paludibacteraceae bacterium]